MTAMTLETKGDTQVVVTRRFAAPPQFVFRAHVEPDLIRRWMTGPEPWKVGRCESDLRPGGTLWFGWTDGQGNGFHLTGEYLEIEPGRRILHVERMFLPDPTPDNRVETLFLPDGPGTRLVMTMTLPDAATRRAMLETGMEHGMGDSYDRLDRLLADPPSGLQVAPHGDRALRLTRVFEAPRPLVWRAFTDEALIPRWLYASGIPMTTCEQDFREGGAFRWGWTRPAGEMIVNGRFLEIDPPARLVHTELFEEDWTGGETTVTTLLHEQGAATFMEMTILYSSTEARDAAARTPMAEGMEEGYARLDGLLPRWA